MFMFKTKDFVRFDLPDSSNCVSLADGERGREFAERRKPREASRDTAVCVAQMRRGGAFTGMKEGTRQVHAEGLLGPRKAPSCPVMGLP